MRTFAVLLLTLAAFATQAETLNIIDGQRERVIPVTIDYPTDPSSCLVTSPCPVAVISAGYRVPYQQYQFLSEPLNTQGYLTVAVDHELENDPPLSRTGDLYQTRLENWRRGAQTLDYLQRELAKKFPEYQFDHLTLIGHSNGGDISAWLANENQPYVSAVITLDHRRVSLPKRSDVRVLSLRATEYPTAPEVLLSDNEQQQYDGCIVTIPDSKHMDMSDYGEPEIKQQVAAVVTGFLAHQPCHEIKALR